MNFFGHAFTATWVRSHPHFVLGAMLPDFATMIGARLGAISEPTLADGVGWHHATDAEFHQLPSFRRLSHSLTDRLAERGIGRGGSLAAGHVGVELVLDGWLSERERADDVFDDYHAALEAISVAQTGAILLDRRTSEVSAPRERLAKLATALIEHQVANKYSDTDVCAERVLRVLAPRPRLAIERRHQLALADELRTIKTELDVLGDEVTNLLRSKLRKRHEGRNSDAADADENPQEPFGR